MKYTLFLFLLALFMIPASAEDNVTIINTIDRHMENWLEIYEHLHANPELSYQEKESSSFLAEQMRDAGFEVTERFGDYGVEGLTAYGVVAILKNGKGPVVLIRTDMDALPVTEKTDLPYASTITVLDDSGAETGVMHACGHDIHMTNFMAVGRTLAENRDKWSGTLMMIGQPSEEMGSGAMSMLKGGLYQKFSRPDYALTLHLHDSLPAGSVGFTPEYAMANVDSVDILIRGIGGHGALPHKTKDPIVLASQIILGLQTISSRIVSPLDPVVVTVGSINGGT
ncbi:MAG: amidohydrolase [Acidobacteriota bacterium]